MKVTVDAEGDFAVLPAAVEVAAFRIVCETLTNATRHAKATTYAVRLVADDGLALEVVDDGRGLPRSYAPTWACRRCENVPQSWAGRARSSPERGKGRSFAPGFPVVLP